MKRDRRELEQNLSKAIDEVKYDKRKLRDINACLHDNNLDGFINELIRTPSVLSEVDTEVLCLISIAVFSVSGNPTQTRMVNQ